jgi:hypothetical protein
MIQLEYRDYDPIVNLLHYLNTRMQLSAAFNPAILPMLHDQTLTQKLQICRPGQVLTMAYWLDVLYAYSFKMVPDKNGKPVKKILEIFPPKTIILDPTGFFGNEPSDVFMEIVKGATIVPFSQPHFAALKLDAPETETLANCILAEMVKQSRTRMELLDLKGDERYYELIRRNGIKILQCFSQKGLASYLNFTPEHLNSLISGDRRAVEINADMKS